MIPEPNLTLDCPDHQTVAAHRLPGRGPGVMFLGGFRSDMTGTKALFLQDWCRRRGRAYVRFDYLGHGASSGRFEEGTIGRWRDDALMVLDRATEGPQVLVGSSMGGWMMLLTALARPQRVAGLVGIASAPDFTEALMWGRMDEAVRRRLLEQGEVQVPSDYGGPYPITRQLIEEGRHHLLLDRPIALDCPVRLLHGLEDLDVPWESGLKLTRRLRSRDVRLNLIKDGDHRLSREQDLALLGTSLGEVLERIS